MPRKPFIPIRARKPFMPIPPKTRILSVDGGGSWALIPALALAEIYGPHTPGHQILADFDYVAANSGGSLVVAGLIENRTPSEICSFFLDTQQRKRIFHRVPWYRCLSKFLPVPRYSTARKASALHELFDVQGRQPLSQLQIPVRSTGHAVRFVFMSYDYRRDRAGFLRSYASQAASSSTQASPLTLNEAVHASTNAPIKYFDQPASAGGKLYWDGGLSGYNNPILAAAIEAVANGAARESIAALSLGTAQVSLPLRGGELPVSHPFLLKKQPKPGLFTNIQKAATTVLADPPDAHSFIAHLLLGGALPPHGERVNGTAGDREACPIIRLNPLIQPWRVQDHWQVPLGFCPREFKTLVKLDMDATKDKDVQLIRRLFEAWRAGHVYNQAIRSDSPDQQRKGSDTPRIDIGHGTFNAAVKAWCALAPEGSLASPLSASASIHSAPSSLEEETHAQAIHRH